jgi:polyhydroxyalkanoate synthesis regulator phasin
VAKAEAEGRVSAGPFSLRGNVYASAGAEATARGSIGYEDGKLRISAGAGAALGLGVGGGAALEVDVKQIGQVATNAATAAAQRATQAVDVNGDGRLGTDDARAVVSAVQERASSAVNAVQERASSAVNAVQERASSAVNAVQDRVNGAASRVRNLFGF